MSSPVLPASPPPAAAPVRTRHFPWVKLLISVLVLGLAAWYFLRPKAPAAGGMGGAPGGMAGAGGGMGGPGGAGRRMMGPTPVAVTTARAGELRVFITALGTVTPLNTATVRSRADGELLKLHFTEGQLVKAGDLLAEIDPRAYDVALQQAEGQLARDRASLENARLDLKRYESAQEAVTQQQVDTARATVAEFAGAVQGDEGNVANARLQLSYCRITAPIDGRTGLRLVDVGNLVRGSDQTGIVLITQQQPISVVFSIPEDYLPSVVRAMGSGEKLPVEAYDRAMKTLLATGQLTALDNQIDPTTGTVRLKATFTNDDRTLFPNQFVNVRLLVNVLHDATLIPTSAVQISAQNRFAFVVNAEEVVQRKQIVTGPAEGDTTAITSGIAPGDRVVVEGLDRLQDGAKVSAKEKTAIVDAPAADARPRRAGPPGEKGERRKNGGQGNAQRPGS